MKTMKRMAEIAVLAVMAMGSMRALAADGTWTNNGNGNWNDSANWAGGIIPNGTSATANITASISQTTYITNDYSGLTLGTINIGSPGNNQYVLQNGTLTMNNGASAAVIHKNSGTPARDSVWSPISLASSLEIDNDSGAVLRIGDMSSASGAKTITVTGNGTGWTHVTGFITDGAGPVSLVQSSTTSVLVLDQQAHTYSGGTTINPGATIQAGTGGNNGAVSPTAPVVLNGTLIYNRGQLRVLSGEVSGGGLLQLKNPAPTLYPFTLELQNDNSSFTGDVVVESGAVLRFGSASGTTTGGIGSADIANEGIIEIRRSNNIQISGAISGTGSVSKSNGVGELTLNGANSYTGDTTITTGSMILAVGGEMRFLIEGNGVNNEIISGGRPVELNGTIRLDLTTAGTTFGDEWDLFNGSDIDLNPGSSVKSLLGDFTLSGGVWSIMEKGVQYDLVANTGVMTVVPEPATWVGLLAGGLAMAALGRRGADRRQS